RRLEIVGTEHQVRHVCVIKVTVAMEDVGHQFRLQTNNDRKTTHVHRGQTMERKVLSDMTPADGNTCNEVLVRTHWVYDPLLVYGSRTRRHDDM
ncbi:hypothetical protein BaRGS_00013502, partial [Batillaria attramentaria]